MSTARSSRVCKSYTIEPEIDQYVSSTRGEQSASERVNELLKRAIIQERYEALGREASAFFAAEAGRAETRALQKATLATLDRD